MTLLSFELKRIFRSLVFWITGVLLIFMITSQIEESFRLFPPLPNQNGYGTKTIDDAEFIYKNLIADLDRSVANNSFTTYPYGWYRHKVLKPQELVLMTKLTKELKSLGPSGEEFENSLKKIDSLLGSGSSFSPKQYKEDFGKAALSYDEAKEEYELMKERGLAMAFTRYFCDYAGIFLTLLSWFLPISLWLEDKKNGIASTIYAKSISSFKLFISRFLACSLSLLFITLLPFSYYILRIGIEHGFGNGIPTSYILLLIWVVPNSFFCSSIASLATIVSNAFLGIAGSLLSFLLFFGHTGNLRGSYGWKLVPRHNTIGNENYFHTHFYQLLANRSLWILIALCIAFLGVWLLAKKRGGFYGKGRLSHKTRTKV